MLGGVRQSHYTGQLMPRLPRRFRSPNSHFTKRSGAQQFISSTPPVARQTPATAIGPQRILCSGIQRITK